MLHRARRAPLKNVGARPARARQLKNVFVVGAPWRAPDYSNAFVGARRAPKNVFVGAPGARHCQICGQVDRQCRVWEATNIKD